MKNTIIIVGFAILLLFSAVNEPTDDVIDTFAGASTETFDPQINGVSGASIYYEDEDEDEDEDEEEHDEIEDEEDDD